MTEPIQYNVQLGSFEISAASRTAPGPLFASEDGIVASLSNNECIFQKIRTGETHVMTFQVLQALDQCREFRPLEDHVARVTTTLPGLGGQTENVRRVLGHLVERKLLVSDRDFVAELTAPTTTSPMSERAVFVRACDRPDQLARLMRSLTDYERGFRRSRRYVLIDDSTSSKAIDRNRDLMREFARATGANCVYLGAAEKQSIIAALVKALPQAKRVLPTMLARQEASSAFGGGRSWNLALLLSAGAGMFLFDDDQCLPLRAPENARAGLDPDPSAPVATAFYRNIESALAMGEEVAGDPFDLHLRVAGQTLGTLLRDPDYAIADNALRGVALSRLGHLKRDAEVLATVQGTSGSSRTESGAWLYLLDAESRQAFWSDRDAYLHNIEAASIWHGCRQARIATSSNFSPFAFDNRRLLPCTHWIGRGEDALFSQVTRLARPDSLVVELPLAVGHVQESGRNRSAATRSAQPPHFNYFVGDLIQRRLPDFMAEQPSERLGLLASHLRDLAGASEAGRVAVLREYLTYSRADLVEKLQQQSETASGAPVYWQADLNAIVQANGKALTSQAPPRLRDWPDDIDAHGCAARLADECTALAEAYEVWPAVWQLAESLGERLLGVV